MHVAYWIHKATNTHSECIILIVLPLQQWCTSAAHCCVVLPLCVLFFLPTTRSVLTQAMRTICPYHFNMFTILSITVCVTPMFFSRNSSTLRISTGNYVGWIILTGEDRNAWRYAWPIDTTLSIADFVGRGQVLTPSELYHRPENVDCMDFLSQISRCCQW